MNEPSHSLIRDTGLLLVGHGTRDEQGVSEFLETAAEIADAFQRTPMSGGPVEPCFLELAEPTISQAVERLVAKGVRNLAVAPLLLFAAGHARHDIPAAVASACQKHAGLVWQQTPPLACHPQIVALSQQRFFEALVATDGAAAAHTLLIMVGRGSLDERATADMLQFSRLRAEQLGGDFVDATQLADRLRFDKSSGDGPLGTVWVTTCFCAMALPRLSETIARAADALAAQPGRAQVVVQPHLLFHGQLLADIRRQVDAVRNSHPEQVWRVANPLGPAPPIRDALLSIVQSSLSSKS